MSLESILLYSAGGVSVAGLIAIAWYVPFLRKYAIAAIPLIIGVLTIYRRGQKDANQQWNKAIERDVAKGVKARSDAERVVKSGRVLRGDKYDRDR